MFKNSRLRQKSKVGFQQELEKQLISLKEQTPNKMANLMRNQEIMTILDEVVLELEYQSQQQNSHILDVKAPRKKAIQSIDQIDRESSISLVIKDQPDYSDENKLNLKMVPTNHISNLVSNKQLAQILKEYFSNYREDESILLFDFVKKMIQHYIGLSVKDDCIFWIKNTLKNQLTTTNSQHLSINALEILAKRKKLQHYFIQLLVDAKIELKVGEIESKSNKLIQSLTEKEERLNYRQQQLIQSIQQNQKTKKYINNIEKALNLKQKDLIQKQKELKKSIEEKCQRTYETYVNQFAQKIKQTEKRLNSTEKNIKYKIEIIEKRAETLRNLINQKNDLKNKKISGDNQIRIRFRKLEKQMEVIEKKHQTQMEQLLKEEKDLLKAISILEEKNTKNQKTKKRLREDNATLQQQFKQLQEKYQKTNQQNSTLQQKLAQTSQQENILTKSLKQKTSRSIKPKKKSKMSEYSSLTNLYQLMLQALMNQSINNHHQFQALVQPMMEGMIKHLPELVCLFTSECDQSRTFPHYLIINITKIIFSEFYLLKKLENTSENVCSQQITKISSTQILQLLKFPYNNSSRFSLFLLLLQIFDWYQQSATQFFAKTIEILIQSSEKIDMNNEASVNSNQTMILVSKQCIFYLANNFYKDLSLILRSSDINKDKLKNSLIISISITDLLINQSIKQINFDISTLKQSNLHLVILSIFYDVLNCIIHGKDRKNKIAVYEAFFSKLQFLQELCQKLSILLQRICYNCRNIQWKQKELNKLKKSLQSLEEENNSNGQRYTLILANLKSFMNLIQQNI